MLSCTLLCRRSATTTWNRLISRFLEDAITRQLFLNLCFNHIYSPLEFNSTKIHQHSTNWTRWNKSDEFWNNVNSLFKRRFLYRRRRCFLRLGATKVYSFFPCFFTLEEVFIHGKVTKNLDLKALLFLTWDQAQLKRFSYTLSNGYRWMLFTERNENWAWSQVILFLGNRNSVRENVTTF